MKMPGKSTKAINRRKEPRYALPTLAAYTDEGADYKEKLINVSKNGCCFASPVALETGEHVLIHFVSTNNYYVVDESFCVDGCIVWRSNDTNGGNNYYGIEFPEVRSDFLASENRAFQDHVCRKALSQYLSAHAEN